MKKNLFILIAFIFAFSSCKNGLNPDSYEIMATDHTPGLESYHILYKGKDQSEKGLKNFIKQFRTEKTSGDANINLYDDSSLTDLVTKFPLSKEEFLLVADHYIAISDFSSPDDLYMYPYQDENYKELGGTNWKKEPIE